MINPPGLTMDVKQESPQNKQKSSYGCIYMRAFWYFTLCRKPVFGEDSPLCSASVIGCITELRCWPDLVDAQGGIRRDLSCVVRKLAFCKCENKDPNQLRSYREADQRHCFRYIDRIIPHFSNSKISSFAQVLDF